MNLEILKDRILKWGEDRSFPGNATEIGQCRKLVEEANEALAAALVGDTVELVDAIGDTFVVLTLLCQVSGLKLEHCVADALEVIEQRDPSKGRWKDGAWVKGSK